VQQTQGGNSGTRGEALAIAVLGLSHSGLGAWGGVYGLALGGDLGLVGPGASSPPPLSPAKMRLIRLGNWSL
jgi:hypothetical protein